MTQQALFPKTVSEAFERFWRAYPPRRPNPKADAERKFFAIVKRGGDPELLVGAAGRFREECEQLGTHSAFIPQARTWLHQDRWRDYPAPADAGPVKDRSKAPEGSVEERLRAAIGDAEYFAWIGKPGIVVATGPGRAEILVPNRFYAEQLERRFEAAIRRALKVETVDIRVRP